MYTKYFWGTVFGNILLTKYFLHREPPIMLSGAHTHLLIHTLTIFPYQSSHKKMLVVHLEKKKKNANIHTPKLTKGFRNVLFTASHYPIREWCASGVNTGKRTVIFVKTYRCVNSADSALLTKLDGSIIHGLVMKKRSRNSPVFDYAKYQFLCNGCFDFLFLIQINMDIGNSRVWILFVNARISCTVKDKFLYFYLSFC